jgi:hypothetical protein
MDALVKLRQIEYEREGITARHITFPDNAKQISLIGGKVTPALGRCWHAVE